MEMELHRTLGKILANQESMNARFAEHFDDDKKQFAAIRNRINGVESKINYGAGALAVLGAVGAVVFGGFYR